MFRKRTAVLILIGIGLVVYLNSLSNAFLGDDRSQIVNNLQIHSLSSIGNFFLGSTYYNGGQIRLTGLYYRPLMLTFYSFIYSFFGPTPLPFHFFQVVIHIISSILAFILFGSFFPLLPAFLLSLLFLIHPINNEAVVYIANLQDVLFVCFGLAAAIFFIRKGKKPFTINSLLLCGFFLLLSLLTKETGIAFIAVLLMYILLYIRKKTFRIFSPLLASFFIYFFFRYNIAHIGITKGQSLAPIALTTLQGRFITMPAILATYLNTFFFPFRLSAVHFWVVTSLSSPDFYLSLLEDIIFGIVVFMTARWIAKKHKKYFSQFLFFLSWFVIGLLPHMQFIPLDTTVAERWFYFSAIGIIGMIGTVLINIHIRNASVKKILSLIVGIVFVLLATRTVIRNLDWRDGVTLYSHDIKTTKSSFLLDNAYATELLDAGEYGKAKPYVEESIKIYPYFANLNNAAIIAFQEKNYLLTKYYLQQALLHSPNYAVYENYANFLVLYYSPQEANSFAKTALAKYPNDPKILYDYGKSEYLLGNNQAALASLKKSETIEPNEKTEALISAIETQSK